MAKTKKNKKVKVPTPIVEGQTTTTETLEQSLLSSIIETCGAESAQLLGSDGLSIKIKGVISTQAATIDAAIGRGGIPRARLTIVHGDEGSGKAGTLSSKVLTPTGWKRMGEMEVGTVVSTPDGGDSTVIGVFPQGEQDVYKITLDDKSTTYCTLDHLWRVMLGDDLNYILTTKELIHNNCKRFKIPVVKPSYSLRTIESIEYSHREECQCIAIGHPEQLYITDDFIVTHNTTLALHVAAETQALGGVVLYMDNEYKLDPDYAKKLGVDTDKMIISQPPYLEKSYEIWDKVIDRAVALREKGVNAPIAIFLDSMNATIAKAQYEGEWDDKHYAPTARVHSDNLPRLMPKVSKEDVTLFWISQLREDIGVKFGNPNKIAGGRAPRFYASLILDVHRSTALQEDGVKRGNEVHVECVKNQIAPPFRKGMVVIEYGKGFDKKRALIEQAVKDEIMEQKGSYFKYKGENIGQGINATKKQMSDDLFYEIMREIEKLRCWDR